VGVNIATADLKFTAQKYETVAFTQVRENCIDQCGDSLQMILLCVWNLRVTPKITMIAIFCCF